jgi:hypothetical protein
MDFLQLREGMVVDWKETQSKRLMERRSATKVTDVNDRFVSQKKFNMVMLIKFSGVKFQLIVVND